MEHGSQYQYSPLTAPSEQIRLLRIPHQSPGRRISCNLFTYSITNLPTYVALSYCWGPPEELESSQKLPSQEKIYIGSHRLDVTLNLFHALQQLVARRLEYTGSEVLIWIDAVCIDQQNTDERNGQVAIMDFIYSRAEKVIVWLGEDARGESALLKDMLPRFVKMHQIWTEHIQMTTRIIGMLTVPPGYGQVLLRDNAAEYLIKAGLPHIGDEKWKILLTFFKRRWFSRVWVIQEVALAKAIKVWFGDCDFMWGDISVCCKLLDEGVERIIAAEIKELEGTYVVFHGRKARVIASVREFFAIDILPKHFIPAYGLLNNSREYSRQHSAGVVLYSTEMFATSNTHDKIFGVLGVLKRITKAPKPLVEVNYHHTTVQVFTSATRVILQETKWLGFLCCIPPATNTRCEGLPSWVFDPGQTSLSTLSVHGDSTFKACGQWTSSDKQSAPDLMFNGDVLGVSGIRVAVVDGKSELLGEVCYYRGDFEEGAKLFLGQLATYQYTNEPLVDVLWRTLIVNQLRSYPKEQWRQSFKSWWAVIQLSRAAMSENAGIPVLEHLETIPSLQLLARQDVTRILIQRQDIINGVEAMSQGDSIYEVMEKERKLFDSVAGIWAVGRCVFRTSEGHFGLGSEHLEIGDEIWIMPRSPVPFILRKSNQSGAPNHYTFINECYVHGIMHGEFFPGKDSPQWESIELE